MRLGAARLTIDSISESATREKGVLDALRFAGVRGGTARRSARSHLKDSMARGAASGVRRCGSIARNGGELTFERARLSTTKVPLGVGVAHVCGRGEFDLHDQMAGSRGDDMV